MKTVQIKEAEVTIDQVAATLMDQPGTVLLKSGSSDPAGSRYSFLASNPFATLQVAGSQCVIQSRRGRSVVYGNPWNLLDSMLARYEIIDAVDLPFPLGGCFGYWGYDLKNFVEPGANQWAVREDDVEDAWLGFFDSCMVMDHSMGKTWLILTGMDSAGNRTQAALDNQRERWNRLFDQSRKTKARDPSCPSAHILKIESSIAKPDFLDKVEKCREYIRKGHIYQVNLAHKIRVETPLDPVAFYSKFSEVNEAPFGAWIHTGRHRIASASPERFLRISGNHIITSPIKGTRPRGTNPTEDARLAYELQTSPKEISELVMITDLLRNDLGKICEYGSVTVPQLLKLIQYTHVQHLVSTVEGHLGKNLSHAQALASMFPGGSITGAPKIRAMQIIDELEPVTRGPYTGCIGYLGFNRESQLSIAIRTAVLSPGRISYYAGSGIVADSIPEFEYEETLHKSMGFIETLGRLKCVWPESGRSGVSDLQRQLQKIQNS